MVKALLLSLLKILIFLVTVCFRYNPSLGQEVRGNLLNTKQNRGCNLFLFSSKAKAELQESSVLHTQVACSALPPIELAFFQ